MPIQIIGSTHGNIIEMTEEFARGSDGVLVLNGTGNVIRISTRRPSFKALIDVDRGNTFELGERSYVGNLNVHLRGGSRATVGADVYAIAVCKLFCHETSSIGIGNGCLIGDQTAIMTSDMHSIVEAATSKRVNPPETSRSASACGSEPRSTSSRTPGSGREASLGCGPWSWASSRRTA